MTKLCEFVFEEGCCKALAASNSAARNVGGDTLHSGLFLGGKNRFALTELGISPTQASINAWGNVHCLILEEISMVHPQMLGGTSYRLCKLRQNVTGCDPNLYQHPDHMFGRIPLVIMLGDFMQLAPIDSGGFSRMSLIMEPGLGAVDSSVAYDPAERAWSEDALAGQRVFFEGLTHTHFLTETHRFTSWDEDKGDYVKDEILPVLLEHMRTPAGEKAKLDRPVVDAVKSWIAKVGDERAFQDKYKTG